jgi:calcineurin-like phosphoesterase
MTKNKKVLKNGQKIKNQYGDWVTLGSVLGCNPDAAKKRFQRGNQKAINAMEDIIASREELKQKYQEN